MDMMNQKKWGASVIGIIVGVLLVLVLVWSNKKGFPCNCVEQKMPNGNDANENFQNPYQSLYGDYNSKYVVSQPVKAVVGVALLMVIVLVVYKVFQPVRSRASSWFTEGKLRGRERLF